jgi:hypothetical protein
MGKRCSPGLCCFALFIALDAVFAQIEAVTDKDKALVRTSSASRRARPYPWKTKIVTTVFWIGEQPGGNNLVPNRTSAWDKQWTKSYGGFDDPNPARRRNYVPIKFIPQQNPFYCALPYNDKAHTGHRPEAPRVVPWFQEAYQSPAVSLAKIDGSQSAKAIESLMHSGKTRDHFERTTGDTCLAMSVQNRI